MKYVLTADAVHANAPVGGKARALAALRRAGLPIPPWAVLLPAALGDSLTETQRQSLQANGDASALRAVIEQVEIREDVLAELRAAVAELCPNGELVAVRSSASDEDGAQHSFAGQLDSFLFVPAEQVADKVKAVWRSG